MLVLTSRACTNCTLQAQSLQNDLFIDLHIVAILSSRAMYLYSQKACDMETWQTDMAMGVSSHSTIHAKTCTATGHATVPNTCAGLCSGRMSHVLS